MTELNQLVGKKKILIVDDDPLLLQVLAFDFNHRGYEVLKACDGDQALKIINSQNLDLVISDVKMPNIDGIKLLAEIRKMNQSIPVFMFITGLTEMTLEDAYNKGADALFSKPFNRRTLFWAVESALLSSTEKNRKLNPKLSTDFKIEVLLTSNNRQVTGQMLNIEQGRMFISMPLPLPPIGEMVNFRILFTEVAPYYLRGVGTIRWVRNDSSSGGPTGCGIEFLKLENDRFPELHSLIETFQSNKSI